MSKQFQLAQKVTYVRVDADNAVHVGEGIIHGAAIAVSKRAQYIVKDGDKTYNLPPEAIDCTPEEQEAYIEHVRKIRSTADDYNNRATAAHEEIISEGNRIVDELTSQFFGPELVE